jgi:pimeloyl-ACP methyl ester carboxylesterase
MTSPADPLLNFERCGAGEPMLLVHGVGSDSCVWEPVIGALAVHFDVIAVDLPGFGRSNALPDDVVPTPRALSAAVAALLDELGIERVHAVGNSLGGWVALELAAGGRARSVTALCPAGLWRAPRLRDGEVYRGTGQRVVRRLRPVIPLLLRSRRIRRAVLAPFVAEPDRVPYGAATRMIRSYGRATAYRATATAMRQSFFADAEEIDVPVTVAFGELDRLIRPARIATPGARLEVLGGCGHIPMWDDPPQVTELIEETARREVARTS